MSLNNTVSFQGTKEQQERLSEIIAKHKGTKGELVIVLQEAQEIYGYLPIEVQKMVADGLNIPLSEVYGVVTFYSQFSLYPKGKYKVSVCLGTACYVKGSGDILEEFKELLGVDVGRCDETGTFSLDATRCIGACGLAPVLTVNDDVYGRVQKGDAKKILEKYKA